MSRQDHVVRDRQAGLDRLGAQIAREQDALLERRNAQAEVRSRIAELDLESLDAGSARSATRRLRRAAWLGGAAAITAAAAVALVMWSGERSTGAATLSVVLTDEQEGAAAARPTATPTSLQVGHFVQAPRDHAVALQFSDGSRVKLAKGGRARLMGLRASGADVSLESGQMALHVQHRESSSWHIGAGPFVVHVTGTRFDVGWVPEADALELTLHDGRVELSGCVFGTGYRVLAGQTVRASCRNEHFDVTGAAGAAAVQQLGTAGSLAASPATPTTPSQRTPAPEIAPAAPASETAKPIGRTREDRPRAEKARNHLTWQALARTGRYAQALAAARALGFHQECTHAGAEDLRTLANVARYGQDSQGEAEALQGLRTRFPGTKRAAWAAFALGRLEFDNHAAYAEAAEWFRIYLNEEPHGELAREALGRLLEAKQRQGDLTGATDLAERYVRDYPQGPHADLARALTSAQH